MTSNILTVNELEEQIEDLNDTIHDLADEIEELHSTYTAQRKAVLDKLEIIAGYDVKAQIEEMLPERLNVEVP